MTKISAKIIADSKNEFGNRLTTMVVTFPRFILAELNTHRMMSRNSASSRATPFEKMVKSVKENPFIPMAWQKDHKGMQGTEYITEEKYIKIATKKWLKACKEAVSSVNNLHSDYTESTGKKLGKCIITKQLCNRLLEPFMWHTVIVTATEWENFFALRCPQYQFLLDIGQTKYRSKKDVIKQQAELGNNEPSTLTYLQWLNMNKGQAEIHMMELAECMWDAMNESTPKKLRAGEWHIPFDDGFHDGNFGNVVESNNHILTSKDIEKTKIKIATARCARVSYTVVGEEGKEANYENDIKLHDRLAKSGHWSPFEHCAKTMDDSQATGYYPDGKVSGFSGWSGNFKGFIQYRKTFNNENITK